MKAVIIRQGEYLTQVAARMGFDAEEVWSHPKNADLRGRREHMDVLQAGDIVFVPDQKPEPLPIEKGVTNRYVARIPRVTLHFTLRWGERVLSDEAYVVNGLGARVEGTSDGEGNLTLEVPIRVRELQIVIPAKGLVFPVRIGDMDPIGERSGVRKRLANLGYYTPPAPTDAPGETASADPEEAALSDAIKRFQDAQKLPITGELDDATRADLVRAHGC